MKVLFVNTYPDGSVGSIIKHIGEEILNRGSSFLVAYGRHYQDGLSDNFVCFGEKREIYWDALKTRLFDNQGFNSKRSTQRLIRIIQNNKPDIIHLHNLHGYYLNLEILFSYLKTLAIPVVITLHDCWLLTGHCAHFEHVGCKKWINGCFGCEQKREYPASLASDHSSTNWLKKRTAISGLKNCTIVVPSKWLKTIVEKSFLKGFRIEVIPNGIDTRVFRKTLDERLIKEKYILAVANVWNNSFKGANFLARISNQISPAYKLVIVGQWKEGKKVAKAIQIDSTTSEKQLVNYYTYASAFINPTVADTFSLVNLEAQACGTNVVSFDPCGVIDSIVLPNSVFVKTGDVEALINETLRVAELPKTDVGEYLGRISAENMARQYVLLYERLLH